MGDIFSEKHTMLVTSLPDSASGEGLGERNTALFRRISFGRLDEECNTDAMKRGKTFIRRVQENLQQLIQDTELPVPGTNTSVYEKAKIVLDLFGYAPKAFKSRPNDQEGLFDGYSYKSANSIVDDYFKSVKVNPYVDKSEFSRVPTDRVTFYIFYSAALAAERPDVAIELLRRAGDFSIDDLDETAFFQNNFPLYVRSFVQAHDSSVNKPSTTGSLFGVACYEAVLKEEKNRSIFNKVFSSEST